MNNNKNIYEGGNFDHNSPRPPIPGEESRYLSDWVGQPSSSTMDWMKYKSSSPVPRKNDYTCDCDPSSPPPRLKWAQSLSLLLKDEEGVKLFKEYLATEGLNVHLKAMDFWFACQGLRTQSNRDIIQQIIKAIYRKFFVKFALPISDELRKHISAHVNELTSHSQCLDSLPVTLFDEAQTQIEQFIQKTTYPNFLKSEMYLQCLESVQVSSSGSSEFSNELINLATGTEPLPILYEDKELVSVPCYQMAHTPGTGSVSTGYQTPTVLPPARLTKDLLLMSQKHRAIDVRPKSEAFASMIMSYRTGLGASHAAYNSYNPVSRQDSEMQSLSSHSDARTESDNMSLTDSSIDGRSFGRTTRLQAKIEARQVRQSAALNREMNMNQILIPRTQRLDTRQCQPMDCDTFAAILIDKLERIKKEQEAQELFDRKLKESESVSSMSDLQSRELANAIREKLQLEDDNVQDILDQHVSRVFSDLTPTHLSPGGLASPRLHSPPPPALRNRHMAGYNNNSRLRRRDKDGFSTFSSDSGNVHDFPDGSEHKLQMVKSKSMPEYAEERFARGSATRRSKKTMTDHQTDSGVSVLSDTPPSVSLQKDGRVIAWLLESDKSSGGGRGTSTHSEMSLKHNKNSHRTSGSKKTGASSTNSAFNTHSRSSSVERSSVCGGGSGVQTQLRPAQPFVADPSMPPLPSPNVSTQLEEARRRLLEDDIRTTRSRQQRSTSSRHYPEISASTQSTLRKSIRLPRQQQQQQIEELTTVVFSFCDEQFPYRTKIPGTQITLKQLKEYLPKKGNYRFFFKTVCEELGNQVIQEEISNDGDVLPLWEGKVMAQVKPID